MNPGTMTERIKLLRPTLHGDSMGGHTVSYAEQCEIWASVSDFGGGLSLQSERPTNDYTVQFVTYYENLYGMTEGWRVEYRGKTYNVSAISSRDRKTAVITGSTIQGGINEIMQHA